MKYLQYSIDGFIKKFPLDRHSITIGRSEQNDLAIEGEFISRQHVKIYVNNDDDAITIEDRGSANGTTVKDKRIKRAVIPIGESFKLGEIEFSLHRGTSDEFSQATGFKPLQPMERPSTAGWPRDVETNRVRNAYHQLLEHILEIGLKEKNFNEFLACLAGKLTGLPRFGCLNIVSFQEGSPHIILSTKSHPQTVEFIEKNLTSKSENSHMFQRVSIFKPLPSSRNHYYAFPLQLSSRQGVLIYFTHDSQKKNDRDLEQFLRSLAKEVELVKQLSDKARDAPRKDETDKRAINEMIAGNDRMTELIKQARKLAASDVFILIQGESGTGKELFARLIHRCSLRDQKKFVALNCAAIPENLLESELFGHEKGAFTGAYAQKKGKLELASGGTLLLDEIGDMPLNLQSKLLRAIQENEFYRLGGAASIKVDLRIISITNRNLKELIAERLFREDLYYRLVHRTLTIPPLRERPEDIPLLITLFTNQFCRRYRKNIAGYSIKAFETLQKYHWPGNVRQLENEINSILNLSSDGEMVYYDTLSDEIRTDIIPPGHPGATAVQFYEKPGKEVILELLEKNNWNKSITARQLNMTYRGLHKKMARLGIEKPGTD